MISWLHSEGPYKTPEGIRILHSGNGLERAHPEGWTELQNMTLVHPSPEFQRVNANTPRGETELMFRTAQAFNSWSRSRNRIEGPERLGTRHSEVGGTVVCFARSRIRPEALQVERGVVEELPQASVRSPG